MARTDTCYHDPLDPFVFVILGFPVVFLVPRCYCSIVGPVICGYSTIITTSGFFAGGCAMCLGSTKIICSAMNMFDQMVQL
jgi:hypothetical protein